MGLFDISRYDNKRTAKSPVPENEDEAIEDQGQQVDTKDPHHSVYVIGGSLAEKVAQSLRLMFKTRGVEEITIESCSGFCVRVPSKETKTRSIVAYVADQDEAIDDLRILAENERNPLVPSQEEMTHLGMIHYRKRFLSTESEAGLAMFMQEKCGGFSLSETDLLRRIKLALENHD